MEERRIFSRYANESRTPVCATLLISRLRKPTFLRQHPLLFPQLVPQLACLFEAVVSSSRIRNQNFMPVK
jgi:hypothetical protein